MINIENLSRQEALRNESVEHDNQTWAYKNFSKVFKCTFNFYDSTTITVDNYDAFINDLKPVGELYAIKMFFDNRIKNNTLMLRIAKGMI